MSPHRFPRAALLICALGWAETACALPVISVIPEVAGGFDAAASFPAPISGFDHSVNQPAPVIVRVNFLMEIHDLDPNAAPPEVGFSNVAFHVNFGGVQRATAPFPRSYYKPMFPSHDEHCGEVFCIPMPTWEFNADDGLDKTDLRYILVQGVTAGFGPEGVDPRRRTGQDGPALLGSVFFHWEGDAPAYVSVELDNPIGSFYDNNGRSYSLPLRQGVVGTVRLGQIPEPGTAALLAVAAAMYLGRRRGGRQTLRG